MTSGIPAWAAALILAALAGWLGAELTAPLILSAKMEMTR